MKKKLIFAVFLFCVCRTTVLFPVLPQSAKLEDVLKDMEGALSANDFKHVADRLEFLSKHMEKGEASRANQQRLVFIASNLVYGITSWIEKRPAYGFDMMRMEAMNTLNRISTVLDQLDELIPAIGVAKSAVQVAYSRSGGMYGMGAMGGMYGGMGGVGMGSMATMPMGAGMGGMGAMGGVGVGAMPMMPGMPGMGTGSMIPGAPMAETMLFGGGTVKAKVGRRSLPTPIPSIREKDVVTPMEMAQGGLKKLGSIFKSSDRKVNFVSAMKSLRGAIDTANTIRKYSDVEKYINADPTKFSLSNDVIVQIGQTALTARKKISVAVIGAPGELSDDDSRIAFAEVVAAIQGELGVKERYVYDTLKSLSPKVLVELEKAQKKAEYRTRKVVGKGLLAAVRMIEYDIPMMIVDAEERAHKQGHEMLVKTIRSRVHSGVGPLNQRIGSWKKFKDREVQLMAQGVSVGLKRLDLTILGRGFDDPESYILAMDTTVALMTRIDLMYEIYKNAKKSLNVIWKKLPQLGWRLGGKDKRQKQFFEELGTTYNQGLSNEQDTKVVVAAGQFLGCTGLTPAELIPAGWGIYVKDNDDEAAARIIRGANYLGWAIVQASRQAYENRQKKEQDRLAAAYQMLGWSGRVTTQIPVFKGVSAMIGNIVKRFRDKLMTIGGLKDNGECYAQLAKVFNLLRGEFTAPKLEKTALKSGLNILFRDFDKKVKETISKDLGRAKRLAKEEGYDESKGFLFDISKLVKPPSVITLYGGSQVKPSDKEADKVEEELKKVGKEPVVPAMPKMPALKVAPAKPAV